MKNLLDTVSRQRLLNLVVFLVFTFVFVKASAQTGYIYVQKKALDETSSVNFPFSVSGGTTIVPNFSLNDNDAQIALQDIGSSQSGRLLAVGTNNVLYYRDLGASTWIATGVNNAVRVDGGAGTTAYIVTTSGTVLYYDGSVTAGTVIYTGTNATDIGSAWSAQPYIVANSGRIYQYSGSGSDTFGSASWPQIGVSTDNNRIDGNPSNGNAVVLKTGNTISSITSAGVSTNLGAFGSGIKDVAVTATGGIFTSRGYINKWISGTSWSSSELTSRNYEDNITAGLGEQVWGIYAGSATSAMNRNIYTRTFDGTTALWLNDERVRTAVAGNSQMIAVAPGTYTLTELVPSGWDLQHVNVYDPTNNSSTSLTGNTITVEVAAGETVTALFENGMVNPFAMTSSCSTVYMEDFGTGAAGTYGAPLAGQTSYHYQTTGNTLANNYKIVGNANMLFSGAANLADHTTGNQQGRMMAIDVNNEPDAFFRRRFTGVIPSATYNYSAWLANINAGASIKPNVTFDVIDPTTYAVLATYNTGDITSNAVWTKYGLSFIATSTVIDLVIRNNGLGGNGNDLAIDDITFELTPPTTPITTVVSAGCGGGTTGSIAVTSPIGAIYEYSKDNFATAAQSNPVFGNLTSGNYTIYARYVGTVSCVVSKTDFVGTSVCGNVWNDVNGDAINNSENPISGGVWVNLVNPATNNVIQSVQVDASGNYILSGMLLNTNYKVILTTTNQTGNLNLIASSLPAGYVPTGTNLSGVANTGNTTGVITINSGTGGLTNQNFGITFDLCNPLTSGNVDSDNDGVSDVCDLDDDNDGIFDTDEKCNPPAFIAWTEAGLDTSAGNVTTTLGGETITVTSVVTSLPSGSTSFIGNNYNYSGVITADAGTAIGGNVQLQLLQNNNLNGTTKITFAIAPGSFGDLNVFLSDFERTSIKIYALDASNNLLPVTNWDVKSYETNGTTPASAPNPFVKNATDITFSAVNNTLFDGQNDDTERIRIDLETLKAATKIVLETTRTNVSINAVDNAEIMISTNCPLKDTDNDGIPDYLDLDSDGDGCADAIEGAGLFTSGQLTTASGTLATQTPDQNFGTDVDANGVPTVVGAAGQGVGNSTNASKNDCIDTDNDGVPDWQDLDDDNDGILDTNENSCLNTAIAGFPNTFNELKPSDFGVNFTGTPQSGLNLTADLSDQFGYPVNSGAVIVTITNANVHPTADAFYIRGDLGVTDWEIKGSVKSTVGIEQGLEYFAYQRREIRLYTNEAQITNLSAITSGNWENGLSGNTYFQFNNSATEYKESTGNLGAYLFTALLDYNDKKFGLYTNDTGLARWSTYFVRIRPECDADMDGIPNRLDLDSDADLCPDANEYYGSTSAVGTDGNNYYGNGNPPATNTDGTVTVASYTGTYAPAENAIAITVSTPVANVEVCEGDDAVFSVTAAALKTLTFSPLTTSDVTSELTYQWQVSADGGTTFTNISGSTSSALTLNDVTTSMNNYQYKVIIMHPYNICSEESVGILTVNPSPAVPTLSAVTQPTCDVSTGSFTIDNYDAAYTYAVTPSTGVTISGNTITAPEGFYTVTATSGACTSIASASVTVNAQPETPVLLFDDVTRTFCSGMSVNIPISSSLPGTTINWTCSDGATGTGDIIDIKNNFSESSYTYSITGTTADGCVSEPRTVMVIVTPIVNIEFITNKVCVGSTIQFTCANAPSASPWFSEDPTIATVDNNGLITGISEGYTFINYTDEYGCNTGVQVIVNPAAPTPAASITTQPSCAVSTGTITIAAPIGAGFTYSVDGINYQSGTTFSGLIAGNYNVIAKNGNGCTSASLPMTINAQAASPATPILSSVTQPTCSEATGSFTIDNYNAAYTYNVTPSSGVTLSGNTITAPAGTYQVTATLDACTSVASSNVVVNAQPLTPAMPALSAVTQPTCSVAIGSFTITNYDATYAYSVNPSSGVTITGNTITAPAGTYQVTATLGVCTSGASLGAVVNAQPLTPAMVILSAVTQPTCSVATGSFTITNYDASFAYSIIPATGVTLSGNTITAPAGTYQITATFGGCTSAASSIVTVNTQPPTPAASIASAGPFCINSNPVQLTGTPAGGIFSGTGINIAGLFSPSVAGVGSHVLTYTYTNQYGCSATAMANVQVVTAPDLSIAPSTQTICSGNQATVNVSGDNGGTVNWTSSFMGLSGTGTTFNTGVLYNKGTSPMVINLNASVAAGSCTDNRSATVTVNPEPRVTVVPSSAVVCFYEIPHFTLRSVLTGTTINWQLVNNADSSIVSSGAGTDNIILFSNPIPSGSYTIKVTGTKDGCTSAVMNVSLIVN